MDRWHNLGGAWYYFNNLGSC
ncbi:MAG: hypothetical protein ACLS3M_01755 [Collinsella sp.]